MSLETVQPDKPTNIHDRILQSPYEVGRMIGSLIERVAPDGLLPHHDDSPPATTKQPRSLSYPDRNGLLEPEPDGVDDNVFVLGATTAEVLRRQEASRSMERVS